MLQQIFKSWIQSFNQNKFIFIFVFLCCLSFFSYKYNRFKIGIFKKKYCFHIFFKSIIEIYIIQFVHVGLLFINISIIYIRNSCKINQFNFNLCYRLLVILVALPLPLRQLHKNQGFEQYIPAILHIICLKIDFQGGW